MNSAVLGSNGEKIIVFYTFKDVREFANFKLSTENLISGSVIQSTLFVVFLEDESQKTQLPDTVRFKYLAKKDYNFLGQLKDKELRELLRSKYDLLLVFGDVEAKNIKLINKVQARKRIISSLTEGLNFDIRLNSSSIKIEQITSFAQEILSRIQSA